MPRVADWQARLERLMRQRSAASFSWGDFDCCLFAADDVHALTGHDPAAGLRGGYGSALQAARLVRRAGGLAELVEQHLKAPAVQPEMARAGDIGLVCDAHGRQALAVHGGAGWHAPARHGLAWLPVGAAVQAWKVG